jgi:hypothetical protein
MVDLDQGGIPRAWYKRYLGPSIGWINAPAEISSTLPITAAGTYSIDLSITYVQVNTTGAVTLILPPATNPAVGPGALPGFFAEAPIVIVDTGGNAVTHPITIQAAAGETIMGLAFIQILTAYGGYTLAPNSAQQTWNSISP